MPRKKPAAIASSSTRAWSSPHFSHSRRWHERNAGDTVGGAAERDIAAAMGFSEVISVGFEQLATLLETL